MALKSELSAVDYWILLELTKGGKRFKALTEKFPHSTVAKELKVLENKEFVERTVDIKARPPEPLYNITDLGRDFLKSRAGDVAKALAIQLKEVYEFAMPEVIMATKHL